jgi:hypothetical protein
MVIFNLWTTYVVNVCYFFCESNPLDKVGPTELRVKFECDFELSPS